MIPQQATRVYIIFLAHTQTLSLSYMFVLTNTLDQIMVNVNYDLIWSSQHACDTTHKVTCLNYIHVWILCNIIGAGNRRKIHPFRTKTEILIKLCCGRTTYCTPERNTLTSINKCPNTFYVRHVITICLYIYAAKKFFYIANNIFLFIAFYSLMSSNNMLLVLWKLLKNFTIYTFFKSYTIY